MNVPINTSIRDKCEFHVLIICSHLLTFVLALRERKRQREREENWKILQRKVSGTSAVTITTTADNDFYNFSFPSKSNYGEDDDDEEEDGEEEYDIMTDEETDAELDQNHEEHHDVIHPDMVRGILQFNRSMA